MLFKLTAIFSDGSTRSVIAEGDRSVTNPLTQTDIKRIIKKGWGDTLSDMVRDHLLEMVDDYQSSDWVIPAFKGHDSYNRVSLSVNMSLMVSVVQPIRIK